MKKTLRSFLKTVLSIALLPVILYILADDISDVINIAGWEISKKILPELTEARVMLISCIAGPILLLQYLIEFWEKYDFRAILRDAARRGPGVFLQRLPSYTNLQLLLAATQDGDKSISPQAKHYLFAELRKRNLCDDDELKAHELKQVFDPGDDLVLCEERYTLTKTLFVTGSKKAVVDEDSRVVRVASISSVTRGRTRFLPYFLEPDYLEISFNENGKTESIRLRTRKPGSWVKAFTSIGLIVKNKAQNSAA